MRDKYNIDDILLEAQQLREKTKQQPRMEEPVASPAELLEEIQEQAQVAADIDEAEPIATTPFSFEPVPMTPVRSEEPLAPQLGNTTQLANIGELEQIRKPIAFKRRYRDVAAGFATKKEQQTGAPNTGSSNPPAHAPASPVVPKEKVDLFDFQPTYRERPNRKNLFSTPVVDTIPPGGNGVVFRQDEESADFDFSSISQKIDQMKQKDSLGVQESPRLQFDSMRFTGTIKPVTERAKKGQAQYADLAHGQATGRFSFGVGLHQKTDDRAHTEVLNTTVPEEETGGLFSSIPTGTGRELKIDDIKQFDFSSVEGSGSAFYDEEPPDVIDDMPDGGVLRYNEYNPHSDRRDIAKKISSNQTQVFVRSAFTLFICAVLVYLGFAAKYEMPLPRFMVPEGSTLSSYFLVSTLFTALLGVICGNVMWNGVTSFFKMRANSDTLSAFAVIAVLVQGIIAFRNAATVPLGAMSLYFPVAGVILLFNCIGKLAMLGRIQQNFRVTASRGPKQAVLTMDSPKLTHEFLPQFTQHMPTIAYSVKADFLSDYMSLSYSGKYDVGVHRAVAPVCIGGAVLVALATRFLTSDSYMAATAFAGVLCVCASLSAFFIENIPLARLANKLTPLGAMVSGNKAIETFCDTNAIVLTENDLFPKGHVYLNGIKAFPGAQIDEAILDAASVLCALKGALSNVFLDMVGGNRQLLKKVDNVVYENNMGLSGWVDGKRVLIGNRMLMQNHGVSLPNDSYERNNPNTTPGNPIYISNTGEVSARFLVEYIADDALAAELDTLLTKDTTLILYTTDANLSAEKIAEIYHYPLDLIEIMPSELQDTYRELAQPCKEAPAEMVYTGSPATMITAIASTINARTTILIATIAQLVQIALGYTLVAFMSFLGYIANFSMVKMLGYQILWLAIILVLQQIKKP